MKAVKTPVIMQMEALECGAASLTMILAYYGKWISLEEARVQCGISRDGASAKDLFHAGRNYGLAMKAYRYETENVDEIPVPSIIHWNFNHFVVFCGTKGGDKKKVVLNDPARGRVIVDISEFDRSFTGIVIHGEPSDEFEKGGAPASVFRFARKRLAGTMGAFVFVIITSLLAAAVDIAEPLFSQVFTDELLPGRHPEWLWPFLGGMAGVLVFNMIVTYLNSAYLLRIRGKFAITSNCEFMWHLLRLPMGFFSQRYAGDLQARQTTNEGITENLLNDLAPVAINLLTVILYLFIMIRYSLILTLVGILAAVVNLVSAQFIVRKTMDITRVAMREEGKSSSATMSGIEMIETIKASGSENGFFERWSGYMASESYEANRVLRMTSLFNTIPELLVSLSDAIVLILGCLLIIKGQFTAGMLLAFQSLLQSFISPALEVSQATTAVQELRASMERVEDVMQQEPDVRFDQSQSLEGDQKLSGDIEIKNLTFGYNPNKPPLLSDFSLHIHPGDKIAFVGSSGCGKSTLAKLISGLYQPWSGEILYDGKLRKQIDPMVFSSSIAVVDQDIILFEDTINNNIKMWDQSIENFEVILAARDARIHDDILLRDGYNTRLLEGGKNFSGGQRQRMEMARVLAQDPTVVILDEATSALDAKTEFEVIEALKERGITSIVIAHRLSTIRDCDQIIVLDQGVEQQRGTHEELIHQDGLYRELITTE